MRWTAVCAALVASPAPALAQGGGAVAPPIASGAPLGLARDEPALEWGGRAPGPSESLLGALLRMLLVLALVLALVYLTLNFGLRRLMRVGARAQALVQVHERIPLEPKKSLYLVEAAGEYLLLGAGEGQVSLLTRIDPEKAREWLARRAALSQSGPRPFWDRLSVKPPKPPGPGQAPPTA